MQLAEEPLVTRREILRCLKLGAPTTDAPLATLRTHRMVSSGWSLPVQTAKGHVAGRLHMYSSLNVDAARAARLQKRDLAQRLATRARALEASEAARALRGAIRQASTRLAAHLSGHPPDDLWNERLAYYVEARRRTDWDGLEREALSREWLARSEAWLYSGSGDEDLLAAVRDLAAATQTARAEETADASLHLDSFMGFVHHLDPEFAEIVSDTEEAWVVSRRELDREGLARLGNAVTVIREELPGGGEAWVAAPAVDLRAKADPRLSGSKAFSPFVRSLTLQLDTGGERWLMRALRRDPVLLPCTPIRVEQTP